MEGFGIIGLRPPDRPFSMKQKASPERTRFVPFNSPHCVPASRYSAAIYLRVSSAGPFVSTSDTASELSGLYTPF